MKAARTIRNPAFVLTFLLLVVMAAGMAVLPNYMNVYLRKEAVESRKHMRAVSGDLPSWVQVGTDREQPADILKTLGTENTITRLYVERDPPAGEVPIVIELHLAYYTGMVDTVPHVSDRCMVGGGWQPLTGSRDVPVELDASGWRRATYPPEGLPQAETLSEVRLPNEHSSAPGTRVLLPYDLIAPSEKDDRRNTTLEMRISDFVDPKTQAVSVIGHFFIANHRLTPSANQVRTLAFDLTDDYAYYAKVQISVSTAVLRNGKPGRVNSPEDLARVAGGFVSEVLPEVMLCLPDWVRLETERRRAKEEAAGGA